MSVKKVQKNRKKYKNFSSKAVTSLVSHLSIVEDPRGRQGTLHIFTDILAIIVIGTICGCDDAEKLEEWGVKEKKWLKTFLKLPYGTPSQDTYLRALSAMNPEMFRFAFRLWAQELFSVIGLKGQIAVDGKTVRGARLTNQTKSAVHMVSALACETGLVLGQVRTKEKSNEITAIPQLLEFLCLKDTLISVDAMGCQVNIAKEIIDGQGNYLFGLKGNQATLSKETKEIFIEVSDSRKRSIEEIALPTTDVNEQIDAGHGRIEIRKATICHNFEKWVPSSSRFPEIKTLIQIQSRIEEKSTGKVKNEKRYYISSLLMNASEANKAVRAHWLVENQLHWCLDVTFNEDACRTRTNNAAENLTVVRHFALSILRAYKGDRFSIRKRRTRCDYRIDYRMKILASAMI